MNQKKITICCPRGHHVRGDARLTGMSVRCPRCEMEFVFTPPLTSSERSGNAKNTSSQVSDTGVMRILGDMSAESVEREEPSVATRPCTRCGVSIPEHVAVCTSCKCYVGILPSFYQQLDGDQATGTHLR